MNLPIRSFLAMLCMVGISQARPVVIENVASFQSPDPSLWFDFTLYGVAVDGNEAIVPVERSDSTNPNDPQVHQTAFLYRRTGNSWALVRQLTETVAASRTRNQLTVAMKDGIAIVQTTPTTIYERGANGWVLAPSDLGAFDSAGRDIEIDDGRIIIGEGQCAWNAAIIEKAADGVWRRSGTLNGSARDCDPNNSGGQVDIDGDLAVVHQGPSAYLGYEPNENWVWRHQGAAGWVREHVISPQFFPQGLLVRGNELFSSGSNASGTAVYRKEPGQGYQLVDHLRPLDSFMGGGESTELEKSGDYIFQRATMPGREFEQVAINVYRKNASSEYEHVAILVAKNGGMNFFWYGPLQGWVAVSGRTVLVNDVNERRIHQFELPASITSPAPRQDNFSDVNMRDWQRSSGSQFRVVHPDRSRVLRQSLLTGDTRAIYTPADFTNQSIELDIKVNQFASSASAVSLITRWQGTHNYYEVLLGQTGLQFRRMASGTLRTLATTPFAIQAGRNYRVRFESVGTVHRLYIDGRYYLDVDSTGPTHGRAGLGTYSASVDFDNAKITPTPHTSIYTNLFYTEEMPPWASRTGDWYLWTDDDVNKPRLRHESTAGFAAVALGVPTTEQSVETSARVMEFAAPQGTSRRWFGLLARYVDDNNFYLLALHSSNSLVLSKRVNGQDITLGNYAVNVVPEQFYAIKLDAIGGELRAYLDGRLLFERTDTSHPEGQVGLATLRTSAQFDNIWAYQP